MKFENVEEIVEDYVENGACWEDAFEALSCDVVYISPNEQAIIADNYSDNKIIIDLLKKYYDIDGDQVIIYKKDGWRQWKIFNLIPKSYWLGYSEIIEKSSCPNDDSVSTVLLDSHSANRFICDAECNNKVSLFEILGHMLNSCSDDQALVIDTERLINLVEDGKSIKDILEDRSYPAIYDIVQYKNLNSMRINNTCCQNAICVRE